MFHITFVFNCPNCDTVTRNIIRKKVICLSCKKVNVEPTLYEHELYTADDFSAEDTSTMYMQVVEAGIPTCRKCHKFGDDLLDNCIEDK